MPRSGRAAWEEFASAVNEATSSTRDALFGRRNRRPVKPGALRFDYPRATPSGQKLGPPTSRTAVSMASQLSDERKAHAEVRKAFKGPGGAGNRPGGVGNSSTAPARHGDIAVRATRTGTPIHKVDASTRVAPSPNTVRAIRTDPLMAEVNARAHADAAAEYAPLPKPGSLALQDYGAGAGPFDLPVPGGVPPVDAPLNAQGVAPVASGPDDAFSPASEIEDLNARIAKAVAQGRSPEAIRAEADLAKSEELAQRLGALSPARNFVAEYEEPPAAEGRKKVPIPDLKQQGPNPIAAGLSGLAAALFPGAGASAVGAVNRATAQSNILARQNALDTYRMQDEASDEEYRDRLATRGEALAMGLRKAAARTDMERDRVAAQIRAIGSEADVRHARVLVRDLGTASANVSQVDSLKVLRDGKLAAAKARLDEAEAAAVKARYEADALAAAGRLENERERTKILREDNAWHRQVDAATARERQMANARNYDIAMKRLGISERGLAVSEGHLALAKKKDADELRAGGGVSKMQLAQAKALDGLWDNKTAMLRYDITRIDDAIKAVEKRGGYTELLGWDDGLAAAKFKAEVDRLTKAKSVPLRQIEIINRKRLAAISNIDPRLAASLGAVK